MIRSLPGRPRGNAATADPTQLSVSSTGLNQEAIAGSLPGYSPALADACSRHGLSGRGAVSSNCRRRNIHRACLPGLPSAAARPSEASAALQGGG